MRTLTLSLVLLLVLLEAVTAQTTINVPGDHPTVQGAIVAAQNGDTVMVQPGTYVENIDFIGKDITVSSAAGPLVTVLDGNLQDSVVKLVSGETNACLEGFTVRNGVTNGIGGGVSCVSVSATIRDCLVSSNHAAIGGGIFCGDSNVTIDNCELAYNTATSLGIAIAAAGNSIVDIGDSVIATNLSLGSDLAAVEASSSGGAPTVTVLRSKIADNMGGGAGADGGGSNLILGGCTITGNTFGVSAVDGLIDNCLIARSSVGVDLKGPIAVRGCTITDNQVGVQSFVQSNSISNTVLWGNTFVYGGLTPTLSSCCVEPFLFPGSGSGVINQDPLFVAPSGGDYHLSPRSPCIDAGDNSLVGLPAEDIDGSPRIIGAGIDIGSDEFPAQGLPGSGEDLGLFVTLDGGGDSLATVIPVQPGDLVKVRFDSVAETFTGATPILVGQIFTTGSPPGAIMGFPELHLNGNGAVVMFGDPTTPPFGSPGLPPGGVDLYYAMPSGISGLTFRMQGFAITPMASNGIFAATGARELLF